MNKLLQFVSLLVFVFSVGCHAKSEGFSPEGKVWEYVGSEVSAVQMIFKRNGVLEFKNGFKWLSPGKWAYNPKSKELTLTIDKAKSEDFENLLKLVNKNKDRSYKYPKVVKEKSKEVIYDFPERILFLGFVFEQEDI